MARSTTAHLGKRIRALRQHEGLTQAALAERLGISASYLNLIEHEHRTPGAELLLAVARLFDVDIRALAPGEDAKLNADLTEVFGDPLFAEREIPAQEIAELAASAPDVARAVAHLHHAYTEARQSAAMLAAQVLDRQDFAGMGPAGIAAEEVSDLIQRHLNHFPELEAEAARLWAEARLEMAELFPRLAEYLETKHGVRVRVRTVGEMGGAMRRFLPERRELHISEVLRRGSRNFQLAHQVALLDGAALLDSLTREPQLTSPASRALGRVALANYVAGAVLMPYDEFLRAAEAERYDIELLGHRFRTNFEQTCHRLTTLQRPGRRGIPFHIARVDVAGNISKKFSATGLVFPRFGGLCPLWGVHAAFLQPHLVRAQLDRLPDGTMYFTVSRTIRKQRGGYHSPEVLYAIGLGCDIESARRMVYADGIDPGSAAAATPVGITCRLCERMDCRARAFPSMREPLRIDENLRGISFYAPGPKGD